jgi:hypothetical protein
MSSFTKEASTPPESFRQWVFRVQDWSETGKPDDADEVVRDSWRQLSDEGRRHYASGTREWDWAEWNSFNESARAFQELHSWENSPAKKLGINVKVDLEDPEYKSLNYDRVFPNQKGNFYFSDRFKRLVMTGEGFSSYEFKPGLVDVVMDSQHGQTMQLIRRKHRDFIAFKGTLLQAKEELARIISESEFICEFMDDNVETFLCRWLEKDVDVGEGIKDAFAKEGEKLSAEDLGNITALLASLPKEKASTPDSSPARGATSPSKKQKKRAKQKRAKARKVAEAAKKAYEVREKLPRTPAVLCLQRAKYRDCQTRGKGAQYLDHIRKLGEVSLEGGVPFTFELIVGDSSYGCLVEDSAEFKRIFDTYSEALQVEFESEPESEQSSDSDLSISSGSDTDSGLEELNQMAVSVPSMTDPNVSYYVNVANGSCTCPDHIHRKRECKHLKALKSSEPQF